MKNNVLLACDIALAFIFISSTASNCLVLLVFYRRPGLRKRSNRFVINLLGTNLLSCWTLLPLVVMAPNRIEVGSSRLLCAICRVMSTGLCTASVLSVLLIGLDQYYAVLDPLHYHTRIDNSRSVILISSSWAFSVGVGVLGGFFGGQSAWNCCDQTEHIADIYVSVYTVLFFIAVFLIPFSLICWMYVSIYTAAHKNSERTRRNGSNAGFYNSNMTSEYMIVPSSVRSPGFEQTGTLKLDSVKPKGQSKCSLRSTSSFIVDSLRYRISNASLFREETRAARISASVIVMGLACWLPFSTVNLMGSPLWRIHPAYTAGGLVWGKLSLTLLSSGSIISALLFAHRNRRVQRDLRKILGITRRSSSSSSATNNRRKCRQNADSSSILPPNFSNNNALQLLGSLSDGTNGSGPFVLCKKGEEASVMGKAVGDSLFIVPLEADTSRSSFSSSCTQRSASTSDVAEEQLSDLFDSV